jgi:hypothetical protein
MTICKTPIGPIRLTVRTAQPYGRLLVMPNGFTDLPYNFTPQGLRDQIVAVQKYYAEDSFGQMLLHYSLAPTVTVQENAPTICDYTSYNDEVLAAATAKGYSGSHDCYLLPILPCNWGGLSFVNGTVIWINGQLALAHDIIHEMGHTIGLYHSHGYTWPQGQPFDIAIATVAEYGDPIDPMGSGNGHMSAINKAFLGWMPSVPSLGRPTTARVVLSPLNVAGANAVSVTRLDGYEMFVEYIQPVGLLGTNKEAFPIRIVDPSHGIVFVTAIGAGETFTDSSPRGGISFRGNSGGTVDIATFPSGGTIPPFPPPPPSNVPPYVTIPTYDIPQEDPPMTPTKVLSLQSGRFQLSVTWVSPTEAGDGFVVPMNDTTGCFWFFTSDNIELTVKVLDGTGVNGHWWVFYGSLTNVEFTLTVTDTKTGAVKTYNNPQGQMASVGDTSAF